MSGNVTYQAVNRSVLLCGRRLPRQVLFDAEEYQASMSSWRAFLDSQVTFGRIKDGSVKHDGIVGCVIEDVELRYCCVIGIFGRRRPRKYSSVALSPEKGQTPAFENKHTFHRSGMRE